MILAVTEHYHDYRPTNYFIDTEKLNENNFVEKMILNESKKKSKIIEVTIDASRWEEEPEKFGEDEPGVSENATVKTSKIIDKSLNLYFDFDC
jgi:hypothetical protein